MVSKQRVFRSLLILVTVAVMTALVLFSEITPVRDGDRAEFNKERCHGNSVVTYEKSIVTYGNNVAAYGNKWKFSSNRSTDPVHFETCQKRFPGAIIVGIMKCGTRALLMFLNLHPEIKALLSFTRPADGHQVQEINFFAASKYSNGLEWYRNQMPCSFSNQITIEKDPLYFWEDFCPTRIRNMDPATTIIIIIKEPITRALSHHAMLVADHGMKNSFDREITHKNGDIIQNHTYLQLSSYTRYIDPWIENYALQQIHFVDGHAFVDTPLTELTKLECFLKIKPYFNNKMFWYNEKKGKHCFYTESKVPYCLGKNKGRTHENITEGLRKKLQAYFKPLNEEFFRKIRQRFVWEY